MPKKHMLLSLLEDPTRWNEFRRSNPKRPDLRGRRPPWPNLRNLDLSRVRFDNAVFDEDRDFATSFLGSNLSGATFVDARLEYCELGCPSAIPRKARTEEVDRRHTIFRGARMGYARLMYGDFSGADFRGADLRSARFDGSLLVGANFSNAHLELAHFEGADLSHATFSSSLLKGAAFSGATAAWTTFDNVDVSQSFGLREMHHDAPSSVSVSTIYRSAGKVPEPFLLATQTNVSADFLQRFNDFLRTTPFEYYSCFLSYAHRDEQVAVKLQSALMSRGVPCFMDRLSLGPGENFEQRILEEIPRADRFMVMISQHSLASAWVRKEIELASDRKPYDFLVIVLDDSDVSKEILQLQTPWHIGDFSRWEDDAWFEQQVALVMRQLRRG